MNKHKLSFKDTIKFIAYCAVGWFGFYVILLIIMYGTYLNGLPGFDEQTYHYLNVLSMILAIWAAYNIVVRGK